MKTTTHNVADHDVRRRVSACLMTAMTVILVILSLFGMAFGQAVTVQTSPAGLSFTVDGATYTNAQTFDWVPGSSHAIATTSPQVATAGTQYGFDGWSDGGAMSHTITIQAVAATYTANFSRYIVLPTGNMSMLHSFYHAATTLFPTGKVLLTYDHGPAEFYDPDSGLFTQCDIILFADTPTLLYDRQWNWKVLLTGFYSELCYLEPYLNYTFQCRPTGQMNTPREGSTATLLRNGKVLIAGGNNNSGTILSSAELYDPDTESFSLTGSMNYARYVHVATLLSNGKVFIAGVDYGFSAELYDPDTETFTSLGDPGIYAKTATTLPNGKVLLTGQTSNSSNLAVVYDPVAGTFTPTAPMPYRYGQTATLLPNGKVLIAGGRNDDGELSSTVLYDSETGIFSCGPNMIAPRSDHTATLLQNGTVLIAGGRSAPLSAELLGIVPATVPITVQANPVGRSFTVDGATYTSARTFDWIPGSSHDIATVSPQNGAAGTRYLFANWSDGGAQSHTITVPTTAATYTATFTTQYQLTTTINPVETGIVSPASGGWYPAGAVVNLSATPNKDYTFSTWSGPVVNAANSVTTVTMNGPIAVSANLTGISLLTATIVAKDKSGLANNRIWPVTLTNSGKQAAEAAGINGLTLIQTFGNPCTPAVKTLFPLALGTLSGGGSATGNVNIDFSACQPAARFSVNVTYGAANGGSDSKTLVNQFR